MTIFRRLAITFALLGLLAFGSPSRASQTTLTTPGAPLTMANLATFLNNAYGTIASNFSGATAPAVCAGGVACQYQFWLDTSTTPNTLRIYDGASWLPIGTVDTTGHVFSLGAGTIVGGSAIELTGLSVRSTGAANDLLFASSEALTADRTLSFNVGDTNRTLTIGASASVSGSNTGDQTITLTGDVTGSGTGSFAATLATVNSNVGTCGSSTAIPTVTLNGKGLATACSTNAVVAPAGTLTGATLAAGVTASSLTSVGTLTGGATGAGFTVAFGSSTLTGQVPLANGGTAANLTASNGGIFYSTASAGAILSGTATANQMLLSGASTTPAWSTVTHPATTTVNQILYSSSTNVIGGITTGNNGVLITSGGGVPSISSTIPNATQDNITRTGTLVSGSTGSGFTVALGSSTITGSVALANGGAGGSLTASNGGIVYSDASRLQILAGTVTASQCLLSGSNAAPSWGSCAGGAAVSSVTANDATLTISPTTGAVLAQVNLANAFAWTAAHSIASSSANAFRAGLTTANPALNVDAATASSVTGLNIKSAAAAAGLAVSVISSGTNENLTIDAKGSGTITLGGTSTGAIIHTRATTLSAALTYGGVALSNAVTGTGNMVLSASPTFTGTPVLATPTATTLNGNTFTTGTYTLTGTAGKTLTFQNSITLTGTDATTMTFPSVSGTIAALNIEDQTLSGGANVTSKSQTAGNITIDCGARPLQYQQNTAAFTITAPTSDGSCAILVTNRNGAGAITFSGFQVGSNTGDTFVTTDKASATCTITNASPGVVTYTAHGLPNNAPVWLTTSGGLPTGLSINTIYYTRSVAANTFQLSATNGGASINTSSAGSGTHTCHQASQFLIQIVQVNGSATYGIKALQ